MKTRPGVTGAMLQARGRYRRALEEFYGRITLAGLAPDDEPILLRRIYVPLVLTPERISEEVEEGKIHKEGKALEGWLEQYTEKQEPKDPFLLVEGEAGSGKTTLVHAVTASLSGEVSDGLNSRFGDRLPVPVLLRHVPKERLGDLDAIIDHWFESLVRRMEVSIDVTEIRAFFDRGDGLFLFDGLDELGSAERRRVFLRALRQHGWFSAEGGNLAILTARPSGFQAVSRDLPRGRRLYVAPFSSQQIGTYLERWFELRPLRVGEQKSAARELLERLTSKDQRKRLLSLARRPAYLAALAFVHGTRGQLPHTRAELYGLLIEAYLEILDVKRGLGMNWNRLDKLQVLSTVAFLAHDNATIKGSKPEDDRRFTWTRDEFIAEIRKSIEALSGQLRDLEPGDAEALFDYFVARTGLLREASEGVFQFGHLSFQEYLTALFLLDQASASDNKAEAINEMLFTERIERSGWLEVAMLVLAVDATRSLGAGHRSVLAKLDLRRFAHRELLTLVLSGEEVKLAPEERQGWLIVWYSHLVDAATLMKSYEDDQIIRAEIRLILDSKINQPIVYTVWRNIVTAIQRGEKVWDLLSSQLPKVPSPDIEEHKVMADRMVQWPRKSWESSLEKLEMRNGWDVELAESVALVLPVYDWRTSLWAAAIQTFAESRTFEDLMLSSDGDPVPRPLWWTLQAWGWSSESEDLLHTVVLCTPVAGIFAEKDLAYFALVRGLEPASSAVRCDLMLELAGCGMVLLGQTNNRLVKEIRARFAARDLAHERSRFSSPPRVFAQARFLALSSSSTRKHLLAKSRSWTLARFLAQTLVWPLARDLFLARDRTRDLVRFLYRNLEKEIVKRFAALGERATMTTLHEHEDLAKKVADDLVRVSIAITALAVLAPSENLNRADLQALRDQLAQDYPEVVKLGITSVSIADALLEDESWESIELTHKAILDSFEARLVELEREAASSHEEGEERK